MNAEDRRILARKVAAAACQLTGCSDDFCQYIRAVAYDDHAEVLAALGGIMAAEKSARKSNVVELEAA